MSREQKDLLYACSIYHLDSKQLRKRMTSMLKYRFKGESYRETYRRRLLTEGSVATIKELRKAMYFIHDLRVVDDKRLEVYFGILSGSGILDEVIEKSIDIAVSRYNTVGDEYYRPIIDLKYDGSGGELCVAVERKINLGHTQASVRHQEALLAVGLAFYTELYAFYIRQLLEEEKRIEENDMKKYKVRKVKGIRIVTKNQGKTDRGMMPRPVTFDLKTRYDRAREKKQVRREIEGDY